MNEQVTEFIIDRKTWYRGNGGDASRLLNYAGQRCCLGFFGQACGLNDEDLLEESDFTEVFETLEHYYFTAPSTDERPGVHVEVPTPLKWLLEKYQDGEKPSEYPYRFANQDLQNFLIKVNDSEETSAEDREQIITEAFAKNGITVKFIN